MSNKPSVLSLLIALLWLSRIGSAQAPYPRAERTLFTLTNSLRAQYHLPPLTWDPALAAAARAHADRLLRESGPLEHQYPGEPDLVTRAAQGGAHVSTISANPARGRTSAASLEQVWMSTPIHRANLLNPQLDAIGIGVLTHDGILFAVQDFATSSLGTRSDDVEARTITLLRQHGLPSVVPSISARLVCQQHATTAEDARLIVQWQGDTSKLPDALLQQLRQSQFKSAAVGACASSGPAGGLASARVAVLLF